MKKNIKIGVSICSICLVAVVGFAAINNQSNESNNEPNISYKHGDFAIDTNNPQENVGFADYYFVAEINQIEDTHYQHEVTIETENGLETIGDPYTTYKILVTENIKGELPTDASIAVTKAGGISQDGRSIIIYENDSLFEVGETYIMTATAQLDGTLLVSGPNSSEKIGSTRILKDYKVNYDNEIIYERDRSVFLDK